ncbi:uncharacterized protein AMSG_02859 [Thecamonas trahens ATCC 50062]|uniref:THH1/TOM1/TOM3 domain-containing protein n=1 Tax=Thecamonas trahens ATCC 50062 TaxID=461836 RepID=A0A0L0D2K9_THETB|nr:hypothetical protein AMSG_02859 [Thecamonas trahens ATCC 50062]KNC46405.1 hypothetical protein AMSG_02859 [Thecamonas trahens ATCC 50062]|eukprot:XP_013760698.1 hypothetical protein AMSG_02859 [Thecamonas trahens ATCC 50062]
MALVLAIAGSVGLVRVWRAGQRYRATRMLILMFCTLESSVAFVGWFAFPFQNMMYTAHILENLVIITVALNLCMYALTISRQEFMLRSLVFPAFGGLYIMEGVLVILIFGFNDTRSAGAGCESPVWMIMVSTGAIMTTVFVIAGVYIQVKLSSLVARNSISRAYYRAKKRKLWILIIIYATCAYLSLAFYIVQLAVAAGDSSNEPCYTFHASSGTALVVERILVHSITFYVPIAAVIYQFSSVRGELDESTTAATAAIGAFSPLRGSSWSRGTSPYSGYASLESYNSAAASGSLPSSAVPGVYRIQSSKGLLTPPFYSNDKQPRPSSPSTGLAGRGIRVVRKESAATP